MRCVIPGCNNLAENNFGVRLRRPDTSAIFAPNTDAYVCSEHSIRGLRITVTLEPIDNLPERRWLGHQLERGRVALAPPSSPPPQSSAPTASPPWDLSA